MLHYISSLRLLYMILFVIVYNINTLYPQSKLIRYHYPEYYYDMYGVDTIELPHDRIIITMIPDNHTYRIPCKIHGKSYSFLLDTGASYLAISDSIKQELSSNGFLSNLSIIDSVRLKQADGRIKTYPKLIIDDFEIGGLHFNNIEAIVHDNPDAPILLGQSVLRKLFAYTIVDDRFIIFKDNPLYDRPKAKLLMGEIITFFDQMYYPIHYYDEIPNSSYYETINNILELEQMCELDDKFLMYLATCYFEIGEYDKCIQTCNRYFIHRGNKDVLFDAVAYSFAAKSLYYLREDFNLCHSYLDRMKQFENEMDSLYYKSYKYFSAICNYYLGDYEHSELDLKNAIKDCKAFLSNNYGYRLENKWMLSEMFLDFALWSYEIDEKEHGSYFLQISRCLGGEESKNILKKHPALYSNTIMEKGNLKLFDLMLTAHQTYHNSPTPLRDRNNSVMFAKSNNIEYDFRAPIQVNKSEYDSLVLVSNHPFGLSHGYWNDVQHYFYYIDKKTNMIYFDYDYGKEYEHIHGRRSLFDDIEEVIEFIRSDSVEEIRTVE